MSEAKEGASFKTAEVVDLYQHRPPYASLVYDRIVEHSPGRERLLDLGCGEGKIARPMTTHFRQVTAVDPSARMIELGKSLDCGRTGNLHWVQASAEDAALAGKFDVVTFASSIHWMDPGRLFPKLRDHVSKDHILAFVSGDTAFQPPWHDEWRQFLAKWVPKVSGLPLDSDPWRASREKHLSHVDVVQTERFVSEPLRQSVESFILCQHSRDTFALSKMESLRGDFHDELETLLKPHADSSGQLTYRVETHLTVAKIKAP